MDLVEIQSFVKVAEERSFTRAARLLFVTPSAISRRLKDLERELGAPLLVRGPRCTDLTPFGEALLPRARELVTSFEGFARHVQQLTGELPRALTVGFPPLLHPVATSTLMDLIGTRVPPPTIQYRPYPNAELAQRLLAGDLDLALIHQHVPTPRIDAVQVLSERVGVAVPAGHVAAGRPDVRLDELCDLVYVTSENVSAPHFYQEVDLHLRHAGIVQRMELPHHELGTMLNLIVAGKAFALCPLHEQSPGHRVFAGEAVAILPMRGVELLSSTFIGWSREALARDLRVQATAEDLGRCLPRPITL
jgi:LysR family transcriptional regulator, benzoate and cis,cis-muconate-responsive activator of ben and cat genes